MSKRRTDWLAVLREAIARDPRGISGVAKRLGYSRPAISRVVAGSYGNTDRIAAAVLAAYDLIDCPHLQTPITPDACGGYARRSYGALTAAEVPHWRACKKCPSNPNTPETSA